MGQRADQLREADAPDDRRGKGRSDSSRTTDQGTSNVQASDIQQTRADMSETIEAIQEQLEPERLTDEASKVVDNAIVQLKAALPEVTDQASAAANKVLDNAILQLRAALPEASDQVSDAANKVLDNAIMQLKAAVHEMTGEAKSAVREATVGRIERVASNTGDSAKGMKSTLMTTIRENPVPSALAGVGIGWLLFNRADSSTSDQTRSSGQSQAGQAVGQAQQKVGDAAGQAQQAVGQAAGQVQETAGQATDQVQQTAGQVIDQVQETAGQVSDQVQYQAQRARGRLEQMVVENPMPIGALALALGGAIGLAVPGTQREQELMGETRDRVVERVQETVQEATQDTVEKVQRVAEEAGDAVEKEAKYQGLTGEQGQS